MEPTEIRAGDSISWTRSETTYPPADGWTLKYFLSKDALTSITITATDDGTDYTVSLAPSASENWTAGAYRWGCFVTRGIAPAEERHTIADLGTVTILPNISSAVAYETRSDARQIYDALIIAYKTHVASSGRIKSYSIAGRSLEYDTAQDILRDISFWAEKVFQEEAEGKRKQGKATGNRILTRFRRPS